MPNPIFIMYLDTHNITVHFLSRNAIKRITRQLTPLYVLSRMMIAEVKNSNSFQN